MRYGILMRTMYSILQKAKKLLRKLTAVFFLFLCVSLLLIGALWYRVNAGIVVARAIAQGDVRLKPFIDGIAHVAYEVPDALVRLTQKPSFDTLRDHPVLEREEFDRIVADAGTLLRTYPYILSCDYYNANGKELISIYLARDGQVTFQPQIVSETLRDFFLRGSVLETGELYMSKRIEQRDVRGGDDTEVISYATPIRAQNGTLHGVIGLRVPSSSFFASFKTLPSPGDEFFVSDAEGNFLYHAHGATVETDLDPKNEALFGDFPDGYPNILSGRGERRVVDDGSFVQVRTLHPAFEVSLDGQTRRINTQGAPLQHRTWFIGYREK